LVRASDPAPRVKRPLRGTIELNKVGSGPRPELPKEAPLKPVSSGDNMLIRPISRVPKDSGSSVASAEGSGKSLPAVEAKHAESGAAQLNSSGAAEPVLPDQVAEPVQESIPVPARSRSGVTQFEFDVEEPIAKPKVGDSRSFEVPIAATSRTQDTSELVEVKPRRSGLRFAVVSVLVVGAIGAVFFLMNNGQFRPVLLGGDDPLLLTVIHNRTNDKALDGVVIEGLELSLRQSRYLTVRGGEAYRAGIRQTEGEVANGQASNRRIAQVLGAKAYLYGEIKGTGAPYTIDVDVLKSDSNDRLTSVEETAEGKDQLAAAIDRIGVKLRANLGEQDREIAKANATLAHEGSAEPNALSAFSMAESALQGGRVLDAVTAYEAAISADPKFTEAHTELAWLYASEKAETAAATEAKLAASTADDGSDRLKLLAQFCEAMNSSGDYARATGIMRQFKELYPHDTAGGLGMARLLRAQGHLPEALQAALQVTGQAPYLADAYLEAGTAMVGMDRSQGALQLQEQAKRLGVARTGSALGAAYLSSNDAVLSREIAAAKGNESSKGSEGYGGKVGYGLYLDNKGQLVEGAAFWRSVAASAGSTSTLRSTAAYVLAMGALDRSLTSECGPATAFAHEAAVLPMGQVASFNVGMAAALCGDKANAGKIIDSLKQTYPKSTAVTGYYVADLQAAMALQAKDPKQALTILSGASAFDQISLTPYLRGMAHLGSGETSLAIADFQTIVDHQGAAFIAGSNVYPMAQIGLARSYAAIGDKVNSTAAYKGFLASWHEADRGQALVAEATAKSR
jgi:eukaryotic-like serine/threonine-protein kinase